MEPHCDSRYGYEREIEEWNKNGFANELFWVGTLTIVTLTICNIFYKANRLISSDIGWLDERNNGW